MIQGTRHQLLCCSDKFRGKKAIQKNNIDSWILPPLKPSQKRAEHLEQWRICERYKQVLCYVEKFRGKKAIQLLCSEFKFRRKKPIKHKSHTGGIK